MANYEATKYNFNGSDLTGIEGIPTATIVPWSSASVPTGFLECDGAAVSRTTYSALFAIVSTTYGAGDGSSTFNVPNLADNVAMGKSGTKALASTGGANTVAVTAAGSVSSSTNTSTNTSTNINVTGNVGGSTGNASLSSGQLASHSHSVEKVTNRYGNGSGINATAYGQNGSQNTGNQGSGGSHSHNMSATFSGSGNASSSSSSSSTTNSTFSGTAVNPSVLQPYLTLIYIIKT